MKKLLFVLIVVFMIDNVDVFAISDVFYKNDYGSLCSGDEKYPVYLMDYRSRPLFFLNYSETYNMNFEDYYEIPFEESPFPEQIKKMAASRLTYTNDYYNRSVHRIIWEFLYPEKSFNMCGPGTWKEDYYYELRDGMLDINDGPEFIKDIQYQETNKLYEYEDEYLNWFFIEDSNGLEALIENNILKVSGEAGEYNLVLKRKNNDKVTGDKLFTDGTNYLLWYPNVPEDEYIMKVVIGQKKYKINVQNELEESLSNICFTILKNEYCSNENGEIIVETYKEEYEINYDGNDYENFYQKIDKNSSEELTIVLKNKKEELIQDDETKEITINYNEIVVVHPDSKEEQIVIEVKDTLEITKFMKKLLLFIGAIFAKFKKI